MKKIFLEAAVIVFLGISGQAEAAFWEFKPKAKAPAKAIPRKAVQPASEANRKIEAQAKESLAAKDWAVYLTPIEGKKAVMDMDVLAFSGGRFTSKNFSNKGYPVSNFTITLSDKDRVEWEVVQTAENGDMAAWKGQLEAGVMKGALSLQPLKGGVRDFYFTNAGSVENIIKTMETQKNGNTKR